MLCEHKMTHPRLQDCGEGNQEHEDCGAYEIEDPTPPIELRGAKNDGIKGIHDGRR
jgi:hypothetical protein